MYVYIYVNTYYYAVEDNINSEDRGSCYLYCKPLKRAIITVHEFNNSIEQQAPTSTLYKTILKGIKRIVQWLTLFYCWVTMATVPFLCLFLPGPDCYQVSTRQERHVGRLSEPPGRDRFQRSARKVTACRVTDRWTELTERYLVVWNLSLGDTQLSLYIYTYIYIDRGQWWALTYHEGIEGNLSLNTIWDYIYMYMEL